ncbi:hypothetical protein [Paraburkholderia tropica]|uniref:hypothetical protein n=1 Tax=Paraburkholderia tropica TaxID=92647 RepID=UPI002AB6FCBB|nr:hypothetical protein [Paraburkholderia tropica]
MRVHDMQGQMLDEWVDRAFYEDPPAGYSVAITVIRNGSDEWSILHLPYGHVFSDAERVGIFDLPDEWRAARVRQGVMYMTSGPSASIAAARAYVMSIFGEEVSA